MTESTPPDVPDEQLPEDLRPTDDNPLAQPLDPDDERTKSAEELGMDETQDEPISSETDSQRSAGSTPRPPADE